MRAVGEAPSDLVVMFTHVAEPERDGVGAETVGWVAFGPALVAAGSGACNGPGARAPVTTPFGTVGITSRIDSTMTVASTRSSRSIFDIREAATRQRGPASAVPH